MTADLGVLERALGHKFHNRELLERALTHKSRIYEKSVDGQSASDNEQLEFLGDAILGFVVSECLVRRYAAYPEGRLSKLKAHLVSAARLHEVAQALDLGEYLFLGRGEEMSGGREKKALLSDAVEALIAAMHLDAGLEAARQFIEMRVVRRTGQSTRRLSPSKFVSARNGRVRPRDCPRRAPGRRPLSKSFNGWPSGSGNKPGIGWAY